MKFWNFSVISLLTNSLSSTIFQYPFFQHFYCNYSFVNLIMCVALQECYNNAILITLIAINYDAHLFSTTSFHLPFNISFSALLLQTHFCKPIHMWIIFDCHKLWWWHFYNFFPPPIFIAIVNPKTLNWSSVPPILCHL